MRASRYASLNWHKRQHIAALKRLRQFALRLDEGDTTAAADMAEYLESWLGSHARLADRMMGAFLRNSQRACKITFRAGTKPPEACNWVSATGDRFNPLATKRGL